MPLRIERTTFLSLTFGMAGLACNTGPSVVAANVVDIPLQPAQPSDAGPRGAAPARAGESAPRAVPEPDVAADDNDDDFVTGSTDEGGMVIAPAACGFVDPKTVTRPTAPCKDDQGTAPACSVMKTCSAFPFPRQHCESYRRSFKPKVAQKALECLAKLTVRQTCDDACTTYRCGDLALKTACPDPSADATCAQIISKCASVSMNDCRTYLSGLTPIGRAKMVSCLTSKSGCGFGIFSCAESL